MRAKISEDLCTVHVKMPLSMVQALDELRHAMQQREPARSITRSDAVRHAISSALTDQPGGEPADIESEIFSAA